MSFSVAPSPCQYLMVSAFWNLSGNLFLQVNKWIQQDRWIQGQYTTRTTKIDAFKLWCWERILSPLDLMEIHPVNFKGNQSWNSLEGLIPRLKLQYFGHLMQRTDSWKRPWCWERLKESGTEDEMVGWHHWFNRHELGHTPGDGEGQGGLVCYNPWSFRPSDMTWWLNYNIQQ